MSSAGAGQAVISPATRRVAERVFVLRDLPAVMLKGIAEPVPLAEVLHPREAAREVQSSLARPEIVGRETELARLMSEARVALHSSGRVFALIGEAGTGKSRLIEDALGRLIRLARDGALPLFFSYGVECQGYEQNTPYAAARELLRQVFSVVSDGPQQAEAVRRRVAMLAPDQARFTPLLGGLISLPLEETPLTAGLTPQQRHDRALDLVEELLLAEARRQPLLLIVDDLHWADASSLELLARLARRVVEAPMLVVFGYRPDPHIPESWRDLPHCVRLSVGELGPEGSEALVRALLRGEPPPELAGLIERAQGNPFFIEEVVRSLVDFGGLERTAQGWRLTRPPDQIDLPDSIEGLITARLDRLEQRCRDVIQAASVIGRRFGYHVLTGILTQRDDLSERLRLLVTDELILPEELERDLAYLFKHALTRDVAYGAILYARRRELHRRVAHEIEHLYADRLDDQLAVLARHYLLAEDWSIAFDYHLWAGRYAQSRYANREAIELLERALRIRTEQGESLQDLGPIPNAELIEINERLGEVHELIGEYDTALARYQDALDLQRDQAEAQLDNLIRVHHYIARVYERRAEFDTAFEWVERALALAGTSQSRELVRCLLLGAGLHRRQGRNTQALELGERALRMAEASNSQRELAYAFKLLGITQLYLGNGAQALDLLRRSVQIYEQAQDMAGLADAHNDLAIVCYEQGLLDETLQHYQAGIDIKEMIGDVYGQAMIANNLGDLFKLQNRIDEAITQYQRSLNIFERLNSTYGAGVLHMNLGATYLLRNDLDAADWHLNRSAELSEQIGGEEFLAELERYLAELVFKRGDLVRARHAGEAALATALRLEARVEEGITRRTLGQILARLGETSSAWRELEHSQSILRATASSHELARSLLALAALAPSFGQHSQGQQMLAEAAQILSRIGAQRDLDEAHTIAAQHGYLLSN
jgi:predicted ATPase